MVQVRIAVADLAAEIERVLGWLAAGDEVLVERGGQVVAALTLPGGRGPGATGAASPGFGMAEVERLLHDPALIAAWEEMELEDALLDGLRTEE